MLVLNIPQLYSQTIALSNVPTLTALLPDSHTTLAWLRHDDGMVAAGVAARLDSGMTADIANNPQPTAPTGTIQSTARSTIPANGSSPDERFNIAHTWWEAVLKNAHISDSVQIPGSGLVAFGSFSFAPQSEAGSTLIIPQVLVGKRGQRSWLTLVSPYPADLTDTNALSFLSSDARALLNAVIPALNAVPTALPLSAIHAHITREIPPKKEWKEQVERVRASIARGEAQKVVLAREVELSSPTDLDFRAIVHTLNRNYRNTWVFAIDGMVGATPEMLASTLSECGEATDYVATRVLAGTLPTASSSHALSSPATDAALISSRKDCEEHRIAAESVVQVLRPLATLRVSDPFVIHLPNVLHLATDVHATLHAGISIFDVIAALHPTAALGGSPRGAALAIISRTEPFDRDRYGAPIGWISSSGAAQWCVALRCARLTSARTARAWAGGGIMLDSQPELELSETSAKLQPVLEAFGAAASHVPLR
ncbi:MAG: isochorismate synthase [Arcanobacterium sp.]|nr:isochorismate synthase [Arcanobacterium sp.]MDY5588694.1 isochorismate synthase [Arcanobacterium sp.]